ncbi:branched-chain amino acid ABC transporter permease [Roseibium sp. M-1]
MDFGFDFIFPQLMAGLSRGMLLFLVASGLSLIFGVMNILNFAHATFWLLGGYIGYTVLTAFAPAAGANPAWMIPVVLASVGALTLLGFALEKTLVQKMYQRAVPEQLLLTFALVLIFGDLIKLVWGVQDRSVFLGLPPVQIAGSFVNAYYFVIIVAGLLVLAGLHLFMTRTRLGHIVRAAVHSREMVEALGIRISTIYMVVFGIGVGLAGLAGAVTLPLTPLALGADMDLIVQCFAVVVVGGFGSIFGTFVAALLIGITYSFVILLWPDGALATVFLFVIATLIFRPWGLFGTELRV